MFYGRNYYINLLEGLLKKPLSSVVTCRGRRRVGKSTLFEEFARRNGCRFLKLEGRVPGDGVGDREQREAFGLQLAEQSPLPLLGLSGVNVLSAAPYLKRGRKGEVCQIDLLIQTEAVAYVVEIKRKRVIGEGIAADVAQKVSRLSLRKGVSVRTVLVYEGELEESIVRRQVFDFLIPARKLLGL